MASEYEIEGACRYDCLRDVEELTYQHPDDAIEAFLDDLDMEKLKVLDAVPLYGFKRMEPDWKSEAQWLVYYLLERLDEELGDPSNVNNKTTPGMLAAAEVFIEAFRVEYRSWACEPCGSIIVDVKAWVREHRPDWLDAEA